MDDQAATLSVPVHVPSLSIGGVNVDPNASSTTNNSYTNLHSERHFHHLLTRKHQHAHTNYQAGDSHFHYTARSVTRVHQTRCTR